MGLVICTGSRKHLNMPLFKKNKGGEKVLTAGNFKSGKAAKPKTVRRLSVELNNGEKDSLMKAFKMFDMDGNGEITKEELVEAMKRLGDDRRCSIIQEEAEEMIKEVDSDRDGKVNYHEFYKMMTDSLNI